MRSGENASAAEPSVTVGGRIRALRRERRWSVREMAAKLKVSPATVSAIENDRTTVTVDRLVQVANLFAVDPAGLIQGAGPADDAARPLRTPSAASSAENGALVPAASFDRTDEARDWRAFPHLAIDPVMASAIKCFVHTGYHGANMRSIAAGAGMSVAGVYHHYENKQQLLVKILDLTMDELDWRLSAARDSMPTGARGPADRLAALVEVLALFHTLRADLAFIGATEMRSVESPNRERIAHRRSGIQRLLDVEIEAAVAAGLTNAPMTHEDGRAISTMCTSLPQWFDNTGPTSPQEIAREYAALALRMVGIR